jgi:hypothetical protein
VGTCRSVEIGVKIVNNSRLFTWRIEEFFREIPLKYHRGVRQVVLKCGWEEFLDRKLFGFTYAIAGAYTWLDGAGGHIPPVPSRTITIYDHCHSNLEEILAHELAHHINCCLVGFKLIPKNSNWFRAEEERVSVMILWILEKKWDILDAYINHMRFKLLGEF